MMLRWAVAMWLLLGTGCASQRVVRLDTGHGAPLEYAPPSWDQSVEVAEGAFKEALRQLVLEEPLSLHSSLGGRLVRASYSGAATDRALRLLQAIQGQSADRWCRAHETQANCLSLLSDGMGFNSTDRLTVALGFAFDPMRESLAEALQETLNPQFFYTVVITGIVSWVALAAAPEPVFSKAAALTAAVLVVYLGGKAFLKVVAACFELKQATDRATTFQELEEAGVRFGRVLGPEGARVFVLAVALALGRGTVSGASWLASRLPVLPSFAEASALGASQVGLKLAAVEQVSAVAVVEGNLVITLAPTAVAMAAWEFPGSSRTDGKLRPAAEELLQQATRRPPELISGFRIYGNKGLVGSTFQRNILLIEAKVKGAAPLRQLIAAFEAEARAAGASRLSVTGHAVVNQGFLSPAIAQRYGFQLRRINKDTIELVKELTP